MPVEFEIDESRHLLITRGVGAVTEGELLACKDRLSRDPRLRSDFDQLGDYTGVTSVDGVTTTGVRLLARDPLLGAGSRRAYVASTDAAYGLLRMFQVFRDGGPEHLQVFRNVADALAWLGRSDRQA